VTQQVLQSVVIYKTEKSCQKAMEEEDGIGVAILCGVERHGQTLGEQFLQIFLGATVDTVARTIPRSGVSLIWVLKLPVLYSVRWKSLP